jgi:hypothetical protein
MKNTITLILLLISVIAKAQDNTQTVHKFGLKAGLNTSVLNNTINTGADFKNGLHLGAFSETRSGNTALQIELLYSNQGYKTDYGYPFEGSSTKINLSYFTVPVLCKIYLGKNFNIHSGLQPGLLVSAREKGVIKYRGDSRTTSKEVNENIKEDYKSVDISVPVGIQYNFTSSFSLTARYTHGLNDINNSDEIFALRKWTRNESMKMTNRVLQLSAGYSF